MIFSNSHTSYPLTNDGCIGTPAPKSTVRLNVGGQSFVTLAQTLTEESPWFRSFLSGRWAEAQLGDGSYFIDANPEIFEHVLSYLRRGIFPLFWDKAKSFDYGKYAELLQEAHYFGIQPLQQWIEAKDFEKAVQINISTSTVENDDYSKRAHRFDGNEEKEYHPTWRTVKHYVCPRGITAHYDEPKSCGRACAKAREAGDDEYAEERVCTILIITKRTVFHAPVLQSSTSSTL